MKLSGADILINCLLEQGVDTIFGYPGGAVLDIYDAIYRNGKINHVITSHEQGAAHAADGYARATGKTGVVLATSGPGATNLVTGIATAYMDSIPMVAITGNVGLNFLGRDSFQEVDICGITMPVTKHNFIVKNVNDLADTVREAFRIASTGRKGPVLVDILKNVQTAECNYTVKKPVPYVPKTVANERAEEIVTALKTAKRPLIMIGGGVISSEASEEVKAFAEKLDAPVVSTLMGLSAYPASAKNYLGMMGMHGTMSAAKTCLAADTIIALGTRFSDRVALNRDKFAENKLVIQIDIEDAEIDKNVMTGLSLMADVKEALKTINILLPQQKHTEWMSASAELKKKDVIDYNGSIMAYKILTTAAKLSPQDTVVATDVGQHQMWTAQYYPFEKPRTLLTSGGLGTMGYGFGAAIGAAFGQKGKHVIMVTGDGSFNMNLNEFSTAVTQNLPITILLMNNKALGMVRQWQKIFYGNRFSQTTVNKKTDYVRLAEAFGAKGMTIEKESDILPVLTEALNTPSPVLVDCRISPDENVLPMIKPNTTYDAIIDKME
jgi:acetolactate synthase-1/2/3 large subunit